MDASFPLAAVRKELLAGSGRLPLIRHLSLAAAGFLFLVGAGIVTWHLLPAGLFNGGNHEGGTSGSTGGGVKGPVIDAQLKSDWEKAHDAYLAIAEKWTARERTDRYDHAKSSDLFRAAPRFHHGHPVYRTTAAAYRGSRWRRRDGRRRRRYRRRWTNMPRRTRSDYRLGRRKPLADYQSMQAR